MQHFPPPPADAAELPEARTAWSGEPPLARRGDLPAGFDPDEDRWRQRRTGRRGKGCPTQPATRPIDRYWAGVIPIKRPNQRVRWL
jgi:hypothetical protein